MGLTYVDAKLRGPTDKEAEVRFLVDSGATYSLVPYATWRELELEPTRSLTLVLADGTHIERHVSECHFTLDLGAAHSPVILGEEGDEALLGVITLEVLGFVLNPYTRQLQPMRMLLA